MVLAAPAIAEDVKKPQLILQVTVDQLRGDLPTRYLERMGKGGFRYLLDEGVVFSNAFHSHANTETVVGHTTLSTGAQPAVHGMIGNLWVDPKTKKKQYNVEDGNYSLLSLDADVDKDTEIDPSQKAAASDGRSPKAILVSTFGDELTLNNNGQSKVFGVSVKDRGAVAMAGHTGKAFWFSKQSGDFVTSNYYYDKYPEWVVNWNEGNFNEQYAEKSWELTNPAETYQFNNTDNRPWKTRIGSYGRVFPHNFGPAKSPYFNTLLTLSPAGDEIVLDFAKTLLTKENIGSRKGVTDYLSVSFSATDYVGHVFGPSSLEAEDNMLRLDRTLADLFKFVDTKVGLENTLIVLSADHGAPDTPGYLASKKASGGYVQAPPLWEQNENIVKLKKELGITGKLIADYQHPYVYFTDEALAKVPARKLEKAVSEVLTDFEGVSLAITRESLMTGSVPSIEPYTSVVNNFNLQRSGNIYMVFKPNWFIGDMDGLKVASTHSSPWKYDQYVPVIFAGSGLKHKKVTRRVETIDIAPTLSSIIKINPPSGATGEVLSEVADQYAKD